ncbi:MAG: Nif3-like dinuclear metal center hexameric protein [Armatimonadota bacterium]
MLMEPVMPVTVKIVSAAIEAIAPLSLAEPWDAVGLQVGNSAAEVSRLLLAVDATLETVAQASAAGAQMIVSHHPLLFSPLSTITAGDPVADVAAELIRRGISLYAAHTNLDVAPRLGTAAALAEVLGLQEPRVLLAGMSATGDEMVGAGRIGAMDATTAGAFAARVAATLGASAVRLLGDVNAPVRQVAVVPGSGGGGLAEATAAGADLLVTGELKHHELLEARARGLIVVLAGHLHTERPVLPLLQRYLFQALPELQVTVSDERWPESIVSAADIDNP